MECHIQPDWLLVWAQNDTELILVFVDTGSHSDLFDILFFIYPEIIYGIF